MLNLHNNKLKTLPFSLATLPLLWRLEIVNNEFNEPLNTLTTQNNPNLRVIKALLREMAQGMVECVQGKVIVLGDAMMGKTSLINSINRSPRERWMSWITGRSKIPVDNRTIGVDVVSLNVQSHHRGEVIPYDHVFVR